MVRVREVGVVGVANDDPEYEGGAAEALHYGYINPFCQLLRGSLATIVIGLNKSSNTTAWS